MQQHVLGGMLQASVSPGRRVQAQSHAPPRQPPPPPVSAPQQHQHRPPPQQQPQQPQQELAQWLPFFHRDLPAPVQWQRRPIGAKKWSCG